MSEKFNYPNRKPALPKEPPKWLKWLGPLGGSVWLAFRIIRDLFF